MVVVREVGLLTLFSLFAHYFAIAISYTNDRDDGGNEWIFESLEDTAELSPFDSRMFWGALYVTPLIWSFLFVVALLRLKLEYLPVIVAAVSLSAANILGYLKCSSSAKNKMKSVVEDNFAANSLASLQNNVILGWVVNAALASTAANPNNSKTVIK